MAEILNYSRVFYSGGYRFQNWRGVLTFIALSTMNCMTYYYILPQAQTFSLVFWLMFIFMSTVNICLGYLIVTNKPGTTFTISIDGITNGRRFVPWSEIDRFGAGQHYLQPGIAYLFFARKTSPQTHRVLMLSSKISQDEFEDVVKRLRMELKESYPELRIGGYEPRQQED